MDDIEKIRRQRRKIIPIDSEKRSMLKYSFKVKTVTFGVTEFSLRNSTIF